MMKLHLLFLVQVLVCSSLLMRSHRMLGQSTDPMPHQDYRNSYYEQKVSIFEMLPQSEEDVIFLGNSITDIGEWSEIWGNITVKNRGISSDITAGVLARIDHIIKGKPHKLFIMIGINDIARNIPSEIILKNYAEILNRVISGSPTTQIFVQSILPTNNFFTEYKNHQNKQAAIAEVNSKLMMICNELDSDVTFIDLNPYFLDERGNLDESYTNDGLHLNGRGYMLWKKLLQKNGYCCD